MSAQLSSYHPLVPEFEFEKAFSSQIWIDYTREHAEIPVFAIAIYLAITHYGPGMIEKPWKCRTLFALWNLFLSVFSICGVIRITPYLWDQVQNKGLHYCACTDPADWYAIGSPGFWVWVFVYSKLPELLDTVFLVVQKKRVIFLHWFHHTTVCLYCWHAFHHRIAPGIWFAAMNYWVHSIMYMYYFLMIFKINVAGAAIFITLLQLIQMVGGLLITSYAAYNDFIAPGSCHIHPSNYKLGLGMYFAYFLLFAILFKNKYFPSKSKKLKSP
eukprot:TRINITY_DN67010_c8_g1_i1.p1 TRINITY_DN67010_c8_g1~~TRINITY_DN67010_c8_g1_i1.p1  ORF type:complete len:271 (-),score=23.05 TRINITY_DN67010_c8_g1_i1:238-1050(-)